MFFLFFSFFFFYNLSDNCRCEKINRQLHSNQIHLKSEGITDLCRILADGLFTLKMTFDQRKTFVCFFVYNFFSLVNSNLNLKRITCDKFFRAAPN